MPELLKTAVVNHLRVAFQEDSIGLSHLPDRDEGPEGLLDCLSCAIQRPGVSFETEASQDLDLAIIVEKHHSFRAFHSHFSQNLFKWIIKISHPSKTLPVVFLSRNEYSDECTLSRGSTAQHGGLNALVNVLQDVPVD